MPEVRTVKVKVPAALLECEPSPAVPGEDAMDQAGVAAYVVQLWSAGEDCRSKVGRIRELMAAE